MRTRHIATGIILSSALVGGLILGNITNAEQVTPASSTTTSSTTSTIVETSTTIVETSTVAPTTTIAPELSLDQILAIINTPYTWGEQSARVVALQTLIGAQPDGIYGEQTRVLHVGILLFFGQSTAIAPSAPPSGKRCPQFADTARAAGWPASAIPRLTFIMFRESRCNPGAYNGRGRDRSYGLVQINTKGALWGEIQRRCGLSSRDQLFIPAVNLACAKKLHDVYGWRPWGR